VGSAAKETPAKESAANAYREAAEMISDK